MEMEKGEKQWKPSNTFLQLKPDLEWDTIKAQLLEKISQALQPKIISYTDYDITWVVPCYQGSHMQLQTEDDYKFLLMHALKPKEPAVNIKIEVKLIKKRKTKSNDESGTKNQTDDSDSDDSDDSSDRCYKKAKKSKWECSKSGCSSSADHCFIHPGSSEHFPLSHNHFTVWAAAWHLPLLQQHISEWNQSQAAVNTPVINFNIPHEIFSIFCPPTATTTWIASPTKEAISTAKSTNHDLLLPTSASPGPHLTLNEFCLMYSLSNSVHQKLDENGYMTSNTITYIHISELKEMGFKHGEIAAMKDAVRQWAMV
ncbi:hypothetical protein BKA82DRAFT_16709 [Pisolithus tinctorius]|uniref:Uncharacterized protein n=1 Tax=Pisolithus tinctorius Marx 270 TaxID=870435 RepID=A0A0C3JJM8_PISTI|nr:hypothetical protein BKA82DRAFT_16709 [Pisolithus tinctorius]KIN97791.1 hypothetical protein M404DRAFT_16709 [Pisolithus tinctorius Marx 270]